MLCPRCKNPVSANAVVCDSCGLNLKKHIDRIHSKNEYSAVYRKAFTSLPFYISAIFLSLSVVFSIIGALKGDMNELQIINSLGLESMFKPIETFIGEAQIAVALLLIIPSAMFCIGTWLLPIAAGSEKGDGKSCFFLLNLSTVIRLVFYSAFGVIIVMLLGASVLGTLTYAERYVSAALAVLMLFAVAVTVLFVLYLLNLIKLFKTVKLILYSEKTIKFNFKLITVSNIVIAVLNILTAIDASLFHILSNAANALFLLTVTLILHRISKVLKPKPEAGMKEEKKASQTSNHQRTNNARTQRISRVNAQQKPYIPREPKQMSFAIPNRSKKYCNNCGEMIAEDLTCCPFCHANQDSANQQHFKI